jgi:hypothetical protein
MNWEEYGILPCFMVLRNSGNFSVHGRQGFFVSEIRDHMCLSSMIVLFVTAVKLKTKERNFEAAIRF